MPIVTSIKSQKSGKRANVYLDDKFAFGIDLDNLVLSKVKVGKEFSEREIVEIIKKAEFQKSLDKLLGFATLRPRSRKEIKDYFRRKKIHESLQEGLFEKLEHFKLIDDLQFAKWWIEQRLQFKQKSKRELIQELRIKGISKEIIEEVLQDFEIDEVKIAKDLLEKKMYKWKNLDQKTKKLKISQYLMGKGFSWDVVAKLL